MDKIETTVLPLCISVNLQLKSAIDGWLYSE